MSTTRHFLALWKEGRERFSKLLPAIRAVDLGKKLGDASNSAGFLIRHISEVELLFSKNVFGLAGVDVHAKTLIAQKIPVNGPTCRNF